MYNRFRWTAVSERRNGISMEYEPLQPYFLVALATHAGCRTFLDVGANIGNYSVFASLIPSVEQIIAFEANPHAAAEIRANAALNALDINVWEKAASSRIGPVSFGMVSRYAGNNAIDAGDPQHQITVEANTLDILGELPAPVCLKIDVEGHELPVLEGAADLLKRPCIIQIEKNGEAALAKLEALGYGRLTNIGPDHYYSNIPDLPVLEIYERSARSLIEYSHENKIARFKRGDIALEVSGKSYQRLRTIAQSLMGRHL